MFRRHSWMAIIFLIESVIALGCRRTPTPKPPEEYLEIGYRPTKSIKDAQEAGYSRLPDIQFWRGITHQSTATTLVVIKLVNMKNNQSVASCVPGPYLIDRICNENNIEQTESNRERIFRLAMSMRESGFKIKKSRNLSRLLPCYSPDELNWAITTISHYSNQQLLDFYSSSTNPTVEARLIGDRQGNHNCLRMALAHAIYLRGLSVGMGCLSPALWISE